MGTAPSFDNTFSPSVSSWSSLARQGYRRSAAAIRSLSGRRTTAAALSNRKKEPCRSCCPACGREAEGGRAACGRSATCGPLARVSSVGLTRAHQGWTAALRSLPGARPLRRADLMIVLFTDFGLHGPYTGQMKAVLQQKAPSISAVDLCRCAGRQYQGIGVLTGGLRCVVSGKHRLPLRRRSRRRRKAAGHCSRSRRSLVCRPRQWLVRAMGAISSHPSQPS
jgi:hypothetical protein